MDIEYLTNTNTYAMPNKRETFILFWFNVEPMTLIHFTILIDIGDVGLLR